MRRGDRQPEEWVIEEGRAVEPDDVRVRHDERRYDGDVTLAHERPQLVVSDAIARHVRECPQPEADERLGVVDAVDVCVGAETELGRGPDDRGRDLVRHLRVLAVPVVVPELRSGGAAAAELLEHGPDARGVLLAERPRGIELELGHRVLHAEAVTHGEEPRLARLALERDAEGELPVEAHRLHGRHAEAGPHEQVAPHSRLNEAVRVVAKPLHHPRMHVDAQQPRQKKSSAKVLHDDAGRSRAWPDARDEPLLHEHVRLVHLSRPDIDDAGVREQPIGHRRRITSWPPADAARPPRSQASGRTRTTPRRGRSCRRAPT